MVTDPFRRRRSGAWTLKRRERALHYLAIPIASVFDIAYPEIIFGNRSICQKNGIRFSLFWEGEGGRGEVAFVSDPSGIDLSQSLYETRIQPADGRRVTN